MAQAPLSLAKHPITQLIRNELKKTKEEAPNLQSVATAEQFAGLADIKPSHNTAIHGIFLDLSLVKKKHV